MKKKYPIIFSSDEKYLVCAEVAIRSVIENGSKDNMYDIYVFHDSMKEDKMQDIKKLACENVTITFLDINKHIDSSLLYERLYFTKAMYYRILIPKILSQYEKALYLDCDLVVNCDVAEMFEQEIGDNVIAGVQDIFEDEQRMYVNTLGIDEDYYINSGVLLFNIKEFQKNKIEDAFFNVLKERKDLRCPDQDAINIASSGKIKLLDMKWNFQWGGTLSNVKRVVYSKKFKENYLKAKTEFKVLHFTTSYKPWIYRKEKLATYWWKYAEKVDEERIKEFQKITKPKMTFKKFAKNVVRGIFGGKVYMKLKILTKKKELKKAN